MKLNFIKAAVVSALSLFTLNSQSAVPTVTSTFPTNYTLAPGGVQFYGSVNPNSLPTFYLFNYGLTTNYGSQTVFSNIGSGSVSIVVSNIVPFLAPNNVYHISLLASNSSGVASTPDLIFTNNAIGVVSYIALYSNLVATFAGTNFDTSKFPFQLTNVTGATGAGGGGGGTITQISPGTGLTGGGTSGNVPIGLGTALTALNINNGGNLTNISAATVNGVVAIEQFGAVGGTTDDTAAFNAAATAGTNIILSQRLYTVNSTVFLTNNSHFYGYNTRILFGTNATGYLFSCATNSTNIILSSVIGDGQYALFHGGGDFDNGDCRVCGPNGWGSRAWTYNNGNNTITNNIIQEIYGTASRSGLLISSQQTNSQVLNCVFENFCDAGIRFQGSQGTFPQPRYPTLSIEQTFSDNNYIGFDFTNNGEYMTIVNCQGQHNGIMFHMYAGNVFINGGIYTRNGCEVSVSGNGVNNPAHDVFNGCCFNHSDIVVRADNFFQGIDFNGCTAIGQGGSGTTSLFQLTNVTGFNWDGGYCAPTAIVVDSAGGGGTNRFRCKITSGGTTLYPLVVLTNGGILGTNWWNISDPNAVMSEIIPQQFTTVGVSKTLTVSNLIDGLTSTPFQVIGSTNGFCQIFMQNTNSGIHASSDLVIGNDKSSPISLTNFINLGINSSGYTDNTWGSNYDGYLFTAPGSTNFVIGLEQTNGTFRLRIGGAAAANDVLLATSNSITYIVQSFFLGNSTFTNAIFTNLSPSTLLGVDSKRQATNITLGAGLTLTGTTLTASGGSSIIYDPTQFGTNQIIGTVQITNGASLTNIVASGTFTGNGVGLTNITAAGQAFSINVPAVSLVTNYTVNMSGSNIVYQNGQAGDACFNLFTNGPNSQTWTFYGAENILWPTNCPVLFNNTNNLLLRGTNYMFSKVSGSLFCITFTALTNFNSAPNPNLTNILVTWGDSLTGNGSVNSLIIGAATNVPSFTLVNTNFISGTLYTNQTGRPILVQVNATLTVAAVAGNSIMALEALGNNTNKVSMSTLLTSIAMSYTNMLSMWITNGGQYTFTNRSTGAGNSSGIIGGQYMVY